MSRCFPYPPPGYARDGASGEALIESIKLQRQREKVKADRKKEKKERKNEKKEKRKKNEKKKVNSSLVGAVEDKSLDKSHPRWEKRLVDSAGDHLQKRKEDETEHLEKSDLTEECLQPVCFQSCCSSDSTQNSYKRKREISPIEDHCNIIRIRLPSQRHEEHDASLGTEQMCSTSGRTDSHARQKDETAHANIKERCSSAFLGTGDAEEFASISANKLINPTSMGCDFFGRDDAVKAASGSKLFESKAGRAHSLYESLFQNWLPAPLQALSEGADSDNQEWLFGNKQKDGRGAKRHKAGSDATRCGSPSLWPRAQYLPDIDVYALPFSIPF